MTNLKECPLCAALAERDRLREALSILYEETADYIRVNNLGDVHHNRSMQLARTALDTDGGAKEPIPEQVRSDCRNDLEHGASERLVNDFTALVEQRVAQTAAEILLIIKGSRMVGQSPIGRLHQVGWNAAVSLISDRVRAIIADPNWLAKHDAELERLTRLDEAKLWEQSYSDALYVYGPGDVRLNIERWRDFKLVRIAELGGGPKNDPHS